MKTIFVAAVLVASVSSALAAGPAQPAKQLLPCEVSALRTHVGANVTLDSAQMLATPAPAGTSYCRVDGRVLTPGANDVKFQVSLPTLIFNGRYFQAGLGGAGGSVQQPRAELLNLGFASASTNKGTNPPAPLDFSSPTGLCQSCGVHLAAVAGQQVTKAFFGTSSLMRYHVGCSGGGADSRTNARDYGTQDFDGVIIGANPTFGGLTIGYGRAAKYVAEHPESWVSPDLLAKVEARILAAYDDADGAPDGIIQDDRNFRLDEKVLRDGGLSDAQIAGVRFLSSGWKWDSPAMPPDGVYPGHPVNRLTQWGSWLYGTVPPPWKSNQQGASRGFLVIESKMRGDYGPAFDFNALNFDALATKFFAKSGPANLNYDAFRDKGGKMILYHGVGDAAHSYLESLAANRAMNSREPDLDKWTRLYLVPGMDHCSGPNGPSNTEQQLLLGLIQWVENGKAPQSIVANRPASDARPARSFLLCPEPQAAIYKKKGDINDAVSWTCGPR